MSKKLCKNVKRAFFKQENQKTAQIFINKQAEVYLYNRPLLSNKKKQANRQTN